MHLYPMEPFRGDVPHPAAPSCSHGSIAHQTGKQSFIPCCPHRHRCSDMLPLSYGIGSSPTAQPCKGRTPLCREKSPVCAFAVTPGWGCPPTRAFLKTSRRARFPSASVLAVLRGTAPAQGVPIEPTVEGQLMCCSPHTSVGTEPHAHCGAPEANGTWGTTVPYLGRTRWPCPGHISGMAIWDHVPRMSKNEPLQHP